MNRLKLVIGLVFFVGALISNGVHSSGGASFGSSPTPVPTPSPRPTQKRRPYNPEEHPPEKAVSSTESSDHKFGCVAPGINLDEAVLVETTKSAEAARVKTETVRDRLLKLQARCVQGKLVGAKRKQIYIYRLIGCWGNPPENYQEVLDEQGRKIAQLKKKYLVIQIPCSGDPSLIN